MIASRRSISGIYGMIDMIEGNDGISYKLFFSQIVTAFPIDADRMDYLLRDSYFSGVTYGIYDVNRIFSSFQCYINDKKVVGLSFKESGIDSILRFIQSRSHLYNQVYFHKTNRSANTMLTYCTNTYSKKGEILLSSQKTIEDLIAFYIENSDEVFLNETVKNKMLLTANEKIVHEKLLQRKLFKRVMQEKIILFGQKKNETLKMIDSIVTNINAKLPSLEEANIVSWCDKWENKSFKDSSEKSLMIAYKSENSKYEFTSKWSDYNLEFKLSDIIVCMVRVYMCRRFHTPIEFKEMKNKILALVHDERKHLKNICKENLGIFL